MEKNQHQGSILYPVITRMRSAGDIFNELKEMTLPIDRMMSLGHVMVYSKVRQ